MPFESKADTLINLANFRDELVKTNPSRLSDADLEKLRKAAAQNRAEGMHLKAMQENPDLAELQKRIMQFSKGESLDFSITENERDLERVRSALQLMLLEGLPGGRQTSDKDIQRGPKAPAKSGRRLSDKDVQNANQDGSADLTKILEKLEAIEKVQQVSKSDLIRIGTDDAGRPIFMNKADASAATGAEDD